MAWPPDAMQCGAEPGVTCGQVKGQ